MISEPYIFGKETSGEFYTTYGDAVDLQLAIQKEEYPIESRSRHQKVMVTIIQCIELCPF
jgi:hypothetical protein